MAKNVAKPKKPVPKKTVLNMDLIVTMILNCESMTAIATHFKISKATLINFVYSTPDYSARMFDARKQAALIWEEKAEDIIQQAADPFELTKARELAHHYRWRASKIAPHQYGDKIQAEVSGDVTIELVQFGDKK